VGSNGILECKFLPKNAHRAINVSGNTTVVMLLQKVKAPAPIVVNVVGSATSRKLLHPMKAPTPMAANASGNAISRKLVPSVFGRNLQCEPVRGVDTREECHWSHACKRFKRARVGTNGILECKFLSKNEHRTFGKRAPINASQRGRQRNLLQAATPDKSTLPEGSQRGWQCNRSQTAASGKCAPTDGSQSVGQCNLGQAAAVHEGTRTEGSQRVGQQNLLQPAAFCKGTAAFSV
jgi:hypothetical protein